MKELAITIKPTMACNMKCRHCFNADKFRDSGIIDVNTILVLFEKVAKEYPSIKVTFHGGEPTLAGLDFYEKIFAFQQHLTRKGTIFRNFFTTNGLLLSEGFIKLLIQNDSLINVSFDGPCNDILRSNTSTVLEHIRLIKKLKGRVRCYCTLSRGSYLRLKEIYDWFKHEGIDFKTLPIEKVGYAKINQDLLMSQDDLVRVLVDVYRYWICDDTCKIRYFTFEEFSSLRRSNQFKTYWFNRKIALNPDGVIYPFGRPNDVNYQLGTPESINSIEDCFSSPKYVQLRKILKSFYERKCFNCKSLGVCNGVAICMTYMYENDESILDYSCCQANKIFQAILDVNDEIIDDFRRGNYAKYSDFIQHKFDEYKGDI